MAESEADQASLLERYQRLIDLSTDLASTLDLRALLNGIIKAAADMSQAEAASILLYDEQNQQLFFEAATNLEEPLMRGLVVPVENSVAGWIVTHCQPVIVPNVKEDPRHFRGIAEATHVETTSLLAVPLCAKGKVVGVLEAINKKTGPFDQEDQTVLVALGAQAAVAIENARLFQQSDLIAEMVHELRTPLASITSAAYLLGRSDLTTEQHDRFVQVVRSETERLSELASAFLNLARLESGRVQFRAERFDLKTLLEGCATQMQEDAASNGLKLVCEIPDGLPQLKADRDKIKQVTLNLLSNAVKYNRPGGRIVISAGAKAGKLFFSISDSGLGIRPEEQAHLFEKFYRGKSSEGLAPGSGLGLAICRQIVEAHGGDIAVTSQVEVGSTFTVTLPTRG